MNTTTEQTVKQLRLAADILETRHPWEHSDASSRWVSVTNEDAHPLKVLADGRKIRLALATSPDNRPLHNPDNLTAEQVGAGWRLLLEEEVDHKVHHGSEFYSTYGTKGWRVGVWRWDKTSSIRLPLSIPGPDPKPDPYAELKQAHKEGKVIESLVGGYWVECRNPTWAYPVQTYRIKPETPPFQLPPPPPGMQWHREDGWTADMLPQGYRPLCVGEHSTHETQQFYRGLWRKLSDSVIADSVEDQLRTASSLVFTHEGKTWTWHKPDDPMPNTSDKQIETLFDDDSSGVGVADRWSWGGVCTPIGWRYAEPETKTVELGPEDVLPGSWVKFKTGDSALFQITEIRSNNVVVGSDKVVERNYEQLKDHWLINRSLPLTGKWNPDAWELCHKPAR